MMDLHTTPATMSKYSVSPSGERTFTLVFYVLRSSIDKIRENGFELTKKRSRRYPTKTITDADYADDIAILANTPNQAEILLHSFERAAAGMASMSTRTKRNIGAIIKQTTFPHETEPL